MRLLIYGIDGGDLEIMKSFNMPFIHQFIKENIQIDLSEDLFNRGWVEILTGKEGKDTHGFYMSPLLDGSHRFSTKFAMKDLENEPGIIPLWKLAEQKGVRYNIMNIPTTTPVPEVTNGVIVGSLGGGLNKIDGIPERLVSNKETKKFLEEKKYIVDIRIPNSEILEVAELFEILDKMETKRTDCFIELSKKHKTEFGFLVNRGTTIVQYLARSAIDSYSTLTSEERRNHKEKWIYNKLEEHYMSLDNSVRRLYEELEPDYFIITADHNTVPHKYRASVTPFLLKEGWLYQHKRRFISKSIKAFVRKMGIGSKLSMLKKKSFPSLKDSLQEYDWKKSVAFGSNYIAGIYINDKSRFGGPVASEDHRKKLITEICKKFNDTIYEDRCGMRAVPCRDNIPDGKFSDCFPDIMFEGSEGIFFFDNGEKFVWENTNYGLIPKDLSKIDHAAFTGDKGKKPICIISKECERFTDKTDPHNLTMIYQIVKRIINTEFAQSQPHDSNTKSRDAT